MFIISRVFRVQVPKDYYSVIMDTCTRKPARQEIVFFGLRSHVQWGGRGSREPQYRGVWWVPRYADLASSCLGGGSVWRAGSQKPIQDGPLTVHLASSSYRSSHRSG